MMSAGVLLNSAVRRLRFGFAASIDLGRTKLPTACADQERSS
jgi:hypothetical protein